MDRAYVAGYFDAEGSVTLSKGQHGWTRTVQIVNSHLPTLKEVRSDFGGHIYRTPLSKGSFKRRKQVYVWKAYSSVEVALFLRAILPHVKEKRHRVIIMLDQLLGKLTYAEAKRRMSR